MITKRELDRRLTALESPKYVLDGPDCRNREFEFLTRRVKDLEGVVNRLLNHVASGKTRRFLKTGNRVSTGFHAWGTGPFRLAEWMEDALAEAGTDVTLEGRLAALAKAVGYEWHDEKAETSTTPAGFRKITKAEKEAA